MPAPTPRLWTAGDSFIANTLNEVKDAIMYRARPPSLSITRASTTQSLTSTAWTPLVFDTVERDTHDQFDGTSTVNITEPGWYWVGYDVTWASTATANVMCLAVIRVNGVGDDQAYLRSGVVSNNSAAGLSREGFVYFSVGDAIQLEMWALEARTTSTGATRVPRLRMTWVSI